MGKLLKVPAMVLYAVGSIWAFFICLGIVREALGGLGMVIAFFLLPITLYLAPWYAGFRLGNWFPLILTYGSTIVSLILYSIGSAIDRDRS